jgi:protease-4
MSINADTLLDRLYLKSQITKWRFFAILFAVIALIALLHRVSAQSSISGDYVARLTIDGVIGDNKKIYKLIDDAADNPRIKAVIVWLDTPGGSAVGGEEIYLHLRSLSQKKPVVAVMRSIAASAGYLSALGTDYIFARDGTITGSIGVIIETAEVTDLAQKIGIKPIVIKSSPLKGTPSFIEKDTPESDRVIQAVVNDFYGRFVEIVEQRRQLPHEKALELCDGRVYSGKRAVDNKLIDAIGGEEDAMNWLSGKRHIKKDLNIKDIKVEKEDSLLDELTQSVVGKFWNRSSTGLDGLLAIWHPQLH